ncbi:acyltransferase family protein [Glycomyces terrestris]|uniref:Acyltransferase n=1 Tax=Glycomyces terrestris TaxID=2493553 RepID=A0A426V4K7_9ACTN|nr:acyltransferase family protein [Glycomyces terrestris]RRS01823.1 acyltransferase [Glycomyces terrestris]
MPTFRPEIQGLRAVAVLLVAVYHIWFGRVSGGVDVFLFLTGFLITGSLLRALERDGRLHPVTFLTRLARRLFPAAAVVLLAVLLMAWLLLPETRLYDTARQAVASGLYYENWALAADAVDYVAQDQPLSPLQHFWSLSVQGQFYAVWPVIVGAAGLLARRLRLGLRGAVFAACAAVFAGSLAYSVAVTHADQARAYFDTGARLWEFALGGMLAVALPLLRPPARLRVGLGWTGLALLLACGALIDVSSRFPGWIALWPTGAALMVIVAGTTGSRWGADRALTWRPLSVVGDHSYALYLWHWPILLGYFYLAGRSTATVLGGLLVLALSFGAAVLTKRFVEDRTAPRRACSRGWSVAVAGAFLVPAVATAGAAQAQLAVAQEELEAEIAAAVAEGGVYVGAAVLDDPALAASLADEVPPVPPLATAAQDLPVIYDGPEDEDCDGTRLCEYGDPGGDRTVALVGASRVAHYFPAFEQAALDRGWRLLVLTKSSCQFTTEPGTEERKDFAPECAAWNDWALERLEAERPDLVVTLADRAHDRDERTYPGFVDQWRRLDAWGVPVLALRDLPRLSESAPECVARLGADACVFDAEPSHDPVDPTAALEGVPDNVRFADLTGYVCPDARCPAEIGNILVYRDTSHLTNSYATSLAPVVERVVLEATGW